MRYSIPSVTSTVDLWDPFQPRLGKSRGEHYILLIKIASCTCLKVFRHAELAGVEKRSGHGVV